MKAGDFVYKAYQPQTPGKVIRVMDGEMKHDMATGKTWKTPDRAEVKWINGKTEIVSVLSLQNFRQLIADHEKKQETHKSKLTRLEDL